MNCFEGNVNITITEEEKAKIYKFLQYVDSLRLYCASVWEIMPQYEQVRCWYTLWLNKKEIQTQFGVLKAKYVYWLEVHTSWWDLTNGCPPSECTYIGCTENYNELSRINTLLLVGNSLSLTPKQAEVLHFFRVHSDDILYK